MTCRRALLMLPLSYMFILCVAVLKHDVFASIQATINMNGSDTKRVEGCIECGDYRCPGDPGKCLLGSVIDPCKCCKNGLCARLDGEPCWNSSIPELPLKNRNNGLCARNYVCTLRPDLRTGDEPQAACVCMEQSPACGNDNKTYLTPCELHEEVMKRKNSTLRLKHLGPCQSRPWIISPLENVLSVFGQRLAINCEAEGFPVPDISWEFHRANGRKVLKLPGDNHGATVHSSTGPEPFMRTSWMQLASVTTEHVGMYHCIANNSLGVASSHGAVAGYASRRELKSDLVTVSAADTNCKSNILEFNALNNAAVVSGSYILSELKEPRMHGPCITENWGKLVSGDFVAFYEAFEMFLGNN